MSSWSPLLPSFVPNLADTTATNTHLQFKMIAYKGDEHLRLATITENLCVKSKGLNENLVRTDKQGQPWQGQAWCGSDKVMNNHEHHFWVDFDSFLCVLFRWLYIYITAVSEGACNTHIPQSNPTCCLCYLVVLLCCSPNSIKQVFHSFSCSMTISSARITDDAPVTADTPTPFRVW